jgi:PAS domain S-box-containing protein
LGEDAVTTTESGQLLRALTGRRDAIAARWNRAIAQTSFVPFSSEEVRRRLAGLTERVVRALLSEPLNRDEAQAIGVALADLRYVHPEALGRTLEVLAEELLAGLPADQVLALQPRLAKVLGRLATGFYTEARRSILGEQETIRAALLTARQEAEAALWASEARFRAIFDGAAIGIGLAYMDGRISEANPALQAMLGYTVDELRGMNVTEFTHPDDSATDWELYRDLNAGQRDHFTIEKRFFRKDGQVVWCDLTSSLLRNADGQPLFTIALMEDITERKQAQETIKQLNADLERRVVERTAQLAAANQELQEEIVRRSRAEAELQRLNAELERRVTERTAQLAASNKELEAFSYSVAHDLRSPLRAIDGFSLAVLEDYAGRLDSKGEDYLRRIRGASQRMGQLIDDLLTLSRFTRREMQSSLVDLSALARAIAREFQQQDPGRDVTFVIAEGLTVHGDATLLQSALENLLGNAWKFTAKHRAATIEFGQTRRNGKTVYFVRDDGAGFDMAYADKLFSPFQRLHQQREFAGTGIGLATVQRIIRRHGGQVWAEGAVEQGATFYFTLGE